jgi:hypothetical protein
VGKLVVYCTTYCNQGHRMRDGAPIQHECYRLPPAAIEAERAGDYELAIAIIAAAKPLIRMCGRIKRP